MTKSRDEIKKITAENEELLRATPDRTDWKGNPIEDEADADAETEEDENEPIVPNFGEDSGGQRSASLQPQPGGIYSDSPSGVDEQGTLFDED